MLLRNLCMFNVLLLTSNVLFGAAAAQVPFFTQYTWNGTTFMRQQLNLHNGVVTVYSQTIEPKLDLVVMYIDRNNSITYKGFYMKNDRKEDLTPKEAHDKFEKLNNLFIAFQEDANSKHTTSQHN